MTIKRTEESQRNAKKRAQEATNALAKSEKEGERSRTNTRRPKRKGSRSMRSTLSLVRDSRSHKHSHKYQMLAREMHSITNNYILKH